MRKTITILSVMLFIATIPLFAQERGEKSLYTLDKLEWVNPWIETGNMAGLVKDKAFLGDSLFSFTDASASVKYSGGSLKNLYDPKTQLDGVLNIQSHLHLGKIFLYGRFGYDYSHGTDSRWRGLTNPYSTPFMLTDSIPGNLSNEKYTMAAGVGIPLGNFSIGVNVSYDVSLMAKHKDLRNKNTYMNFDISPGFMYNGKKVRAGLNVGYVRNTEKIEYLQVDQTTEKYLFDLYGVWLYKSSGFSSANTSRMKEYQDLYGAFQLDLDFDGFRLFNEFEARYSDGGQSETGYNNLLHGDTKQLTYRDDLSIFLGIKNRIRASVEFSRMEGFRYLQRQELDPNSNVRRWVSYGGPINCYGRDYANIDLNYTYRQAKTFMDITWEGTIGVSGCKFTHKYKEYPLYFSQKVQYVEPYISFTKYWKSGKTMVDLTPHISYSQFISGTMNEISKIGDTEVSEGSSPWQLTSPLEEEYSFWASSKFTGGIDFRYGYILGSEKGMVLNIKAYYRITGATDGICKNTFRHYPGLSIGLTF